MGPDAVGLDVSEQALGAHDLLRIPVLDIDDTLYLERSYVESGFREVDSYARTRWGIMGLFGVLWEDFESGVRGNSFDLALARYGVLDARYARDLVDCYRSHTPKIELLPDAARFLGSLGGSRVALITDGPSASQRQKIAALGLGARVSLAVVTDELGPGCGKPSEVPFERVESYFGLAGRKFCYVADNPLKDFVAPLARGWESIRIRRVGSQHEALPTPEGVIEFSSLDGLERLFIRGGDFWAADGGRK